MAIENLERRFGNVAVAKGYITPEQLVEAMTIQIREEVERSLRRLLGTILFELGYITIDQIDDVLRAMNLADSS